MALFLLGAAAEDRVNPDEAFSYETSHALLIGVSAYGKGWRNLPGVKRELQQVAAMLRRHRFEVEVVMDPTRKDFDSAIGRFIREWGQGPENRLVVYFAGHGHTITTSDGRKLGYILPSDAPLPAREHIEFREKAVGFNRVVVQDAQRQKGEFKNKAVSMNMFQDYATQIESRHVLFVFDSCFSGVLFDSLRGLPAAVESRVKLPVREFITAGTAEQQVPDDSLFGDEFVDGLKGAADLNHDGYITGTELGMFLEDKVASYSNGSQTPRYGKIRDPRLDQGEIVFTLRGKHGVMPAQLRSGGGGAIYLAAMDAGPEMRPDLESRPLYLQKPLKSEISAGQAHQYTITLAAGQFVRITVNQRGIDVTVIVADPTGKRITEVDSPTGIRGPEIVDLVSVVSGLYQVEVRPVDPNADAGRYSIVVNELRSATSKDRALFETERLASESKSLYSEGRYGESRVAAEKILERRLKYLEPENPGVAEALESLGTIEAEMGELQRGKELLERSLAIRKSRSGPADLRVASLLDKLGGVEVRIGDLRAAAEFYNGELAIQQLRGGDVNVRVAVVLNKLASVEELTGIPRVAVEHLQRARAILTRLGWKGPEVALVLSNLASAYRDLGDLVAAKNAAQRAVEIEESNYGRKSPYVAASLSNLGAVLYELADYEGAALAIHRSLAIRMKIEPESAEVARSLDNLGAIYLAAKDLSRAEALFGEALSMQEKIMDSDHPEVAVTLRHLGALHRVRNDVSGAEKYFRRALEVWSSARNDLQYAETLRDICALERTQSNLAKSLKCSNEELELTTRIGDRRGSAQALADLGETYLAMSDPQTIWAFQRALLLFMEIGDRRAEADTLEGLARANGQLGDQEKARRYQQKAREVRLLLDLPKELPRP